MAVGPLALPCRGHRAPRPEPETLPGNLPKTQTQSRLGFTDPRRGGSPC